MGARRFVRRLSTAFRLLREFGPLIWHRGFAEVVRVARQHASDGGGLLRFLLWCREANAYMKRDDAAEYTRWLLAKRGGRPPSLEPLVHPDVLVVDVARLSSIASEIESSTREFVLLTHADALLESGTLHALVERARSDIDVVFCDEDVCTVDQRFGRPIFKPEFSIDLHRACDVVGPVYLTRRDLLLRALASAGVATAHGLLLRMYEMDARMSRIAETYVHWNRDRSFRLSGEQAAEVDAQIARMYGAESVAALSFPPRFESVRSFHRVSIIIPTRDRIDLLSRCVETLYAMSGGSAFEVLVLDNGSERAESQRWLTAAPQRFRNLRVVPADYPFNWSRLNNHGASMATGEVLLFLNNDVEALTPNWLARLSAQATRYDIGAVGALLLYPGGEIQHAGIVIGIGGFADHVYSGVPAKEDDTHRFVNPLLPRNVLACTGACLTIERRKLEEVGGFDERLRICGDVDISLRLIELGYQNVYDSTVKLLHHESATRRRTPLPEEEIATALRLAARYIDGDPYYNPNLSKMLRYPTLATGAEIKRLQGMI